MRAVAWLGRIWRRRLTCSMPHVVEMAGQGVLAARGLRSCLT
jgi:hypothetical protein